MSVKRLKKHLYDKFSTTLKDYFICEDKLHVAVALSGGPDSTALALLTHRWVNERNGYLTAFIVDHGIRKNSADEALQTLHAMARLGIHAIVLTNTHPIIGNIQSAARSVRYALLSKACADAHILHMFVAHHADDQAETFQMRSKRDTKNSFALASMPFKRVEKDLTIVRPLLAVSKNDLISYLAAHNANFIQDPSNQNEAFERVKLRTQHSNVIQLTQNAFRAGQMRESIETQLHQFLCDHVTYEPSVYASFNLANIEKFDKAVLARAMLSLLSALGGENKAPRYAQCASLLNKLTPSTVHSLGGCIVHTNTIGAVIIYREPNRITQKTILKPYETVHWDNRFAITNHSAKELSVIPCVNIEIYSHMLPDKKRRLKQVTHTLPLLAEYSDIPIENGHMIPHITTTKLTATMHAKPKSALTTSMFNTFKGTDFAHF